MKDQMKETRTEATNERWGLKKISWLAIGFTVITYFGFPGCSTAPKKLSPEKLEKVLTDPLNIRTNRDPEVWELPTDVESYADASQYRIYTNKGDGDVLIFVKKTGDYTMVPSALLEGADMYGLKEEVLVEVPEEDLSQIVSAYLEENKNKIEAISDKVLCPTDPEAYEEAPVGFYAKSKDKEILVSEDKLNGYGGNSRKYYISAIEKKPGEFYVKQGVLYIESYENQNYSEFKDRYGDLDPAAEARERISSSMSGMGMGTGGGGGTAGGGGK